MSNLLNATVTAGAELVALAPKRRRGRQSVVITPGPASSPAQAPLVPMSIAPPEDFRGPWIRMDFLVGLDPERQHLAVETSSFGLCVDPDSGLCACRFEYDRSMTTQQVAHVHMSGESAAPGYAYALAGRPTCQEAHGTAPASGWRRFRPTLEHFIEFLHQEQLLASMHEGWQTVIDDSRALWLARQPGRQSGGIPRRQRSSCAPWGGTSRSRRQSSEAFTSTSRRPQHRFPRR